MNEAPIKEITFGPKNDYIKAAIWENQTQQGQPYYATRISRHYRDDDGWNETQTMYANHLPLAGLANAKAFEFIQDRVTERNMKKEEEPQTGGAEKATPAKKKAGRKTHTQKIDDERKSNNITK